MAMAQLEGQSQQQTSFDHVHKTKTLIKALNLPLPPDLFDTASSIYYNGDDNNGLNDNGNISEGYLSTELEDALLKQRPNCMCGFELTKSRTIVIISTFSIVK
ncbi:hypothetical protein FEM48_Zijuj12G0088300 [Ziziphus jujuba var. spinosa]|uniref:Uncharacterized protein n=1 Tax=Ziziphus jujuba var. spinosa TaxID=714518 RepID=A0A978UCC0_ZIZJJ|nr:hypothetical protein FEM48_Zijuj12G0088300 [Ziziphus jujuba var. spinosa]